MNYRNSVVTPGGYLYNIIVMGSFSELESSEVPPFVHRNEGIILVFNDIILQVYGPDSSVENNKSWLKSLGYQTLDESTFGYFTWSADEEIHINHTSPYIYYDSTGGAAATEGIVVTKLYTPQAGDVSPFQGTAITTIQSTARTRAVAGGGANWFEGCTYLRQVVMHNAGWFGDNCFKGCTSLSEMYLNEVPCTFGTDCFLNAGVVRGTIYAEGTTDGANAGWVLSDLPAALQDKAWIVRNNDNTAYAKYWAVDLASDAGWTLTPSPAFTTIGEFSLALNAGVYSIAVTDIWEGSSLKGWRYYTASGYDETIVDTTNPKNFLFTDDTYLLALNELPEEHVEPEVVEPEVDEPKVVEPKIKDNELEK